uniref:X-ray radiation resistance associated 1 n=2 Tax=Scleropages formosus TaxID=113540 RepID=A0A8C9SUF2_SCLFO
MAAAQFYKLDDGKSRPTHCFPVRSFFQQGRDGAGHWLVAHRNAVEHKYRRSAGRRAAGPATREHPSVSHAAGAEQGGKAEAGGGALDGPLLMKLYRVDKPSDLCSADVSGRKLHSVKEDDLKEFDSVAYVNASDNRLTLEAFRGFPLLRELELSMNGLRDLRVTAARFPHLRVLDVSFNNLSSGAILDLARLPSLKVLHVTGNKLCSLPDPLAAATRHAASRRKLAPETFFRALEVLMLDDNCLSSPGVFVCLAGLKRLRHLDLRGNCITGVPYLQPGGDPQEPEVCGEKRAEALEKVMNHILSLGTRAPLNEPARKTGPSREKRMQAQQQQQQQQQYESFTEGAHVPFAQLQHLNLAHNKIAEEEALLAVALFPGLRELVIHSNPLTTQRSGDPPLLTALLQERLGIQIRRKKTEGAKPHMTVQVNPNRKIETTIPKVPKGPVCSQASGSSPPAPGHVKKSTEDLGERASEDTELPGGGRKRLNKRSPSPSHMDGQDAEGFFMTQLNDVDGSTWGGEAEEKRPTEERMIPEKFRGYEILLEAEPDPEMVQPVGIQQTVRALERALEHLPVEPSSQRSVGREPEPHAEKPKTAEC